MDPASTSSASGRRRCTMLDLVTETLSFGYKTVLTEVLAGDLGYAQVRQTFEAVTKSSSMCIRATTSACRLLGMTFGKTLGKALEVTGRTSPGTSGPSSQPVQVLTHRRLFPSNYPLERFASAHIQMRLSSIPLLGVEPPCGPLIFWAGSGWESTGEVNDDGYLLYRRIGE